MRFDSLAARACCCCFACAEWCRGWGWGRGLGVGVFMCILYRMMGAESDERGGMAVEGG